jgi:hypothetical protein
MAKGDAKVDVRVIIRAHRASYVDVRTDRPRVRDFLVMEGLPLVGLAMCLIFRVQLSRPAAVGLLAVSALLSALFFGLMLQTADRAMSWADAAPPPGPSTSSHATLVQELAAHAGYAALVCIAAAVAYVVATVSVEGPPKAGVDWPLRVSSAAGLALGGHLVLVLLMVMKRVFLLTQERLDRARTGTSATSRKRAS